jgi:hypothetical protein
MKNFDWIETGMGIIRCHDTQNNENQYINIQHNDTQHEWHSAFKQSVEKA